MRYPNLYVLEPAGNTIVVEEINDLIYQMSVSSINNEFKIAIIKEADLMSGSGGLTFNKMLKTLEDPPDEKCIFILLTEDINAIIPTVRSRCQIYNWIFNDKLNKNFNTKFDDLKNELEILLKDIISDRKNITAALNFSARVSMFIPAIGDEIIKKQKKEIDKVEKSGFDEEEIQVIVRKIEENNKREISKLTSLIIRYVFDIISACLEDIIIVIAGGVKNALHFRDNYNIINESFEGESINKYLDLLKAVRENKIYAAQSINYEIALDRIILGLVQS